MLEGLDRTPGRGAYGVLESFGLTIAEPNGPHDGVGAAQGGETCAERNDVIVAAHIDCGLWACLHARIALPAHVGLDVIGTAIGRIDVHDVGRADIHAVSAAVATRHINKCGHGVTFSPA